MLLEANAGSRPPSGAGRVSFGAIVGAGVRRTWFGSVTALRSGVTGVPVVDGRGSRAVKPQVRCDRSGRCRPRSRHPGALLAVCSVGLALAAFRQVADLENLCIIPETPNTRT